MQLLMIIACLAVATACGYFLYEVKYPKPGTRPAFWKVVLTTPVAIVFAITAVTGMTGLFSLGG